MTDAPRSPARARRRWAIRLAVSVAVLAALLALVPWPALVGAFRTVSGGLWLGVLVVFLAGHVVSAAKWQLLVRSDAGFGAVLRAHFAGLVANLCLPGVAGGDVVRATMLYGRATDTTRLAAGSIADRLVDTLSLLLLAAGGLACVLPDLPNGSQLLAILAAAATAAVAGLVLVARMWPWVMARLGGRPRWQRLAGRIAEGIAAQRGRPGRLVACLALSLLVQAAFVLANVELAVAAGVDLPAAAWFFAWPMAKFVATLPISLGGLGVREASLAGLLAPFGASAAAVIASGLLWQSVLIAGGLLGGAIVMLSDRLRPEHS